ncbi:hypothetical protein [Aerococcus sp. UMB7834]|uniref:hypothetical protein n=1 Tax=Aerococcus sp. UMB7834 TaxID=3046342 RepID=UPI00254BD725|nr:hypothetical protein [Aerococcus sp. UMB7834]MDK6805933.1 hypothetical protein [Aerococcus sp. UMB7834]
MKKETIYSPFALIFDIGLLVAWFILQNYLGFTLKETLLSPSTWFFSLAVLTYVYQFIKYHKGK